MPTKIVAARHARGLSQAQLASLLGTSTTAVSRWENANRKPRRATASKLELALGLPIADLLQNDDGVA